MVLTKSYPRPSRRKPLCGHHGPRLSSKRTPGGSPRKGRRPRPDTGRGLRYERSERTNVLRLRALGTLRDVELDLLVLVEGLVALRLDRGVVDEDVVTTVLLGDEAEALLGVEPLNGALSHARISPCFGARDGHFDSPCSRCCAVTPYRLAMQRETPLAITTTSVVLPLEPVHLLHREHYQAIGSLPPPEGGTSECHARHPGVKGGTRGAQTLSCES